MRGRRYARGDAAQDALPQPAGFAARIAVPEEEGDLDRNRRGRGDSHGGGEGGIRLRLPPHGASRRRRRRYGAQHLPTRRVPPRVRALISRVRRSIENGRTGAHATPAGWKRARRQTRPRPARLSDCGWGTTQAIEAAAARVRCDRSSSDEHETRSMVVQYTRGTIKAAAMRHHLGTRNTASSATPAATHASALARSTRGAPARMRMQGRASTPENRTAAASSERGE
eukprot:gene14461-biopygen4038